MIAERADGDEILYDTSTATAAELDSRFKLSSGATAYTNDFTVWSCDYVYFLAEASDWPYVGRVPRNPPCKKGLD